jgi:acetyl esterase/lipase
MIAKRNEAAMKALGKPPAEIKQTELEYSASDGSEVRAKLYQPQPAPKEGSPLIVIYHGGGFCVGSPEDEEQSCRNFVHAFGATCIAAAYRLAPEFPFPYAITDSWDALKWAAANAEAWGADPSKGFVIGGTSAGGNISAALALIARDEKLSPPLTGQYPS